MEERFAACYIRVSTEEQTEYSPDAQRRALERYAGQHKMTILPEHIYIDAGLSGRRAATRPGFQAMIAAAKNRPPPFSVILVHKFDRFARNREDSIVYKSMLRRQCGVQVVSITEHLEDDRMNLILEAMLEAMAEYYSINLADEVRKGMTEKARRGELQTAPPFGYSVRENSLVPLEREATVVPQIYEKFLSGFSMVDIARWTQRTGLLTHRGNPMDTRQIRYILTNPVYLGYLRWHPHGGGEMTVPAGHQPLISREIYDRAQLLLAATRQRQGKHARPNGERKHWLAGVVRCAQCGGGLIFTSPRYLKCGRYAKGRCAASQHVPAERLEEALMQKLRLDAGTRCCFSVQLADSVTSTKTALQQELTVIERKLSRLREAFLCGAETPEEYKNTKEALTARADRLRRTLEAEPTQEKADALRNRITIALSTLEDPEATTESKYRAAQAILETCTWSKADQTLTLVYRKPYPNALRWT